MFFWSFFSCELFAKTLHKVTKKNAFFSGGFQHKKRFCKNHKKAEQHVFTGCLAFV